jgi:hypothetical protein
MSTKKLPAVCPHCRRVISRLLDLEVFFEKDLFTIVAFDVPKNHSILYKQFLTEEELLEAVKQAIRKGANVISIRRVIKENEIDT